MTLHESGEKLPLINHGGRDQEDFNGGYYSFRDGGDRIFSTINTSSGNREVSCPCYCSPPTNLPHCSYFSSQSITYSWNNLSVSVSGRETLSLWKRIPSLVRKREYAFAQPERILKRVYGIAYPGEFLAIMGASGAGKTTLLDALTFRTPADSIVEGSRRLNGRPANRDAIARLSAYVQQDNSFIGTLSVKEHLVFQSLIRLDRNIPYRQKLKRAEDIIVELGLEKCQNTMIGIKGNTKGISGGERKRLSFAAEILTNPPIMFCDEPTSGLDSFMALNVINVLKSVAIKGKTVICTIHQPSSEIFSLFDKILLVAEGRTAFLGSPTEAISFFSSLGASPPINYNPSDFFIQLLAVVPNNEEKSRTTIKIICSSFDNSPQGLEIATKIELVSQNQVSKDRFCSSGRLILPSNLQSGQFSYPTTWLYQFRALFWRSWINIVKESLLLKVRFFQTVVLSLMVGLIYSNQKLNENGVMNINGVLFTFLTSMTFQNLFAVISVFCNELPVFMNEQSNRLYRIDAYFLAKTLAEIPIFIAIPVIFTSITYYWINLNPELYHFVFAVLILILVTNVAISFGYVVSCISTNVVMALSVGPPVIIPFLLFGGFLLNAGSIPAYFKWLSYLSWFNYGNEALLINQWSDVKNIECNRSAVICPRTGEIVLEMYHFEEKNFWWDIGFLFMLIFLFRFLAFSALFFKTAHAQHRTRL